MKNTDNRLAGFMLIALPIAFNVAFALLQQTFDYPDILRQAPALVLRRFAAGGPALIGTWYAFMLSAVLFVPAAILLGRALAPRAPGLMSAAVPVGVLAGAVQFIGLARWPFVMPYLAQTFAAPETSAATRDAVIVAFEILNRYAGMAIGEHLGYLFTGLWTLLVSAALLMSAGLRLRVPLALLGGIAALGVMFGLLEGAGVEAAGAVNAISYVVWSVWLIVLGVALIAARVEPAR
jgi:Domain of unknown function (DUF4386)